MIIKTAKEIIKQAKFLSQSDNSDFLDFATLNGLLNNIYKSVYETIISHNNIYMAELEFSGSTYLPEDCYSIHSIVDVSGKMIEASPKNQPISGCYTIENNKVTVHNSTAKYTLKYYTLPQTITCPDDKTEIRTGHNIVEVISMGADSFIYKTDMDEYYEYSFIDMNEVKLENSPTPKKLVYMDKDVTWNSGSILIGGEDYTDILSREGTTFKKVVCDEHAMFITYSDDEIYLFNFYNLCRWNLNDYRGRRTRGVIDSCFVDDSTGRGVIFHDDEDNKYYLCSYVPDTLLNFPSNIYYEVIEVRLALLLCSLLGIANEYLIQVYSEKVEQQFIDTINKSESSPNRVRNINTRVRLV